MAESLRDNPVSLQGNLKSAMDRSSCPARTPPYTSTIAPTDRSGRRHREHNTSLLPRLNVRNPPWRDAAASLFQIAPLLLEDAPFSLDRRRSHPASIGHDGIHRRSSGGRRRRGG
jgi:hypothetical protein